MDLTRATIAEVAGALVNGALTSTDLVEHAWGEIERLEPELHAFLHLRDRESLLREATVADNARKRGRASSLLAGIPVALKDNICTVGTPTTAGSRILEGFRSLYDATVVDKLKAAGALILGKCNLDEFAMGSSTENSAYGPTRNPWDSSRVPGGSSGGSAAAVSSGMVLTALGSDTGGSIRQPAALTGVVGLKPTYGAVSRRGLIAFGSSLDQIGPLTRTVADAALVFEAIAGHDPLDATSANRKIAPVSEGLHDAIDSIRVGVPVQSWGEGLDKGVETSVRSALDALAPIVAGVAEIDLPLLEASIPAYYLVATAEASANLSRFDGVRYGLRDEDATTLDEMYKRTRGRGFGTEVKRRILLGTHALSSGYYDAYYLRAMKVRRKIADDFARAFETCDVIALPATPTPAFPIGEQIDDPITMYRNDLYTIAANLAGLPAISIPCGLHDNALPIGVQLMAPRFEEARLLRVASHWETKLGTLGRPPRISADGGEAR